jgi:hypothetical protein
VTAEQFLQLLGLLVDPLPDDLKQQMVQLFDQLGRLAPDFATFRAATKSCLLLEQLSTYTANRVRATGVEAVEVPRGLRT